MSDVGRCPKHDELLEIEMFGTTPLCRSCLREPKPGTPEGLSVKFTREFETDAASPNYQQTKATKWEVGPERAELQVSLLNEIGLTLTAVAKEQVAQAETLKTYKLSLEGIQGLLVDLAHSFDVIAEVQANSYDAVVTKFTHIQTRLAQIEERLRTEMEGMRNIVDALGERLERGASAVIQQSHQAQINKLFERQDEHKKYILEALQGLDYYQRNRFMALEEKLSIGPVTVKRKPPLRPVSRKKRKR